MGQNAKYSMRADVFRFASKLRHSSMRLALRICAKGGGAGKGGPLCVVHRNSMRIGEMPKVETIVMPSGGFWGGVGEPTNTVASPAVLNVFLRRPASAFVRCR